MARGSPSGLSRRRSESRRRGTRPAGARFRRGSDLPSWRRRVPVARDRTGTVDAQLTELVLKELIEPVSAEIGDDDAFRFHHLLLRDVAYESVQKDERAALHERLAAWLDKQAGGRRSEYDEIVGYPWSRRTDTRPRSVHGRRRGARRTGCRATGGRGVASARSWRLVSSDESSVSCSRPASSARREPREARTEAQGR